MRDVAIVVPAHNPDPNRLGRTLEGLKAQTAEPAEVLLVDNASTRFPPAEFIAHHGPAKLRVVTEPKLGLSAARRCGLRESSSEVVIFVDDDNVLAPDYIEQTARIFATHASLGAIGGRSLPDFEKPPEPWHHEFFPLLALRDLGAEPIIAAELRSPGRDRNEFPPCAPIGAGMAMRRSAIMTWLASAVVLSDRCGARLTSAGDNEIVFAIMQAGFAVGYFPELVLTHLIPAARLDPDYLARLNRGIQESWMQVLSRHDANSWPSLTRSGAWLRRTKAWFTYRAWQSPAAWIRWQGACGHFAGRVS